MIIIKTFNNLWKLFILPNNDKESMIAKYRSKVKEDETRNINNWNKDFDKLKKSHLEELDSNEIDNFLKYAEKPTITQPQSTKILNLSNVPLTKDEIDILKLGQSFTQISKQNRTELENDIFQLTRKLRLTYHYRNSNIADESIVKLESTYTPKPNENVNLENICKELKQTKISLTKDNLHTSWKGLDSLIWKIDSNKLSNLQSKVQLLLLCHRIIVGIYASPIFETYHITEF